jgi:hypothetical protein
MAKRHHTQDTHARDTPPDIVYSNNHPLNYDTATLASQQHRLIIHIDEEHLILLCMAIPCHVPPLTIVKAVPAVAALATPVDA